MSPVRIYLTVIAAAVFLYVAASIVGQLTRKQLVCLIWALSVAGAIYAAEWFGLTNAVLWRIEHRGAPAAQVALVNGADIDPLDRGTCTVNQEITNWQGEVETVLLFGGDNERLFLTIKIAPNVLVADATRYDDISNPVRRGTPAFDQAEGLTSGQRVVLSGWLSSPGGLCGPGTGNSGNYALLFRPSVITADQSLLVVKGLWVQILVWAFLTSPVLFFLISGRTSAPTRGVNMKNTPASAVREFGEGVKGADVAALLQVYQTHLSKGENQDAKLALDVLEGIQPKDDEEWMTLTALCRTTNRTMGERILCEHYLIANPTSICAQLRLAQLLAPLPNDRLKMISITQSLLGRYDLAEQQMLELAAIFISMRDQPSAIEVYRRLLSLHPDNLDFESKLLSLRIDVKVDADVIGAVRQFRAHIPDSMYWYITCANLASRVKDTSLFEDCASHLEGRMHTVDLYWNRQFVDAYIRLGRRQDAQAAYLALDYDSISSEAALKRLLDLAEFHGFTSVALKACRRLVAVAPTASIAARLSQLEFFQGTS